MNDLSTKIESMKSQKIEPYTYIVEKGKIKEFANAIGDLKDDYLNGKKTPPTFSTVIELWGSTSFLAEKLGLNMSKVLHGEQGYEYLGEINAGDEITVSTTIENAYTKASMNFIIIKKEFINQRNEAVLISRSTIIERH